MNKLNSSNLERMLKEFFKLKFEFKDKDDRIGAVIQVVFNNVVNNPRYSTVYARLVIHYYYTKVKVGLSFHTSLSSRVINSVEYFEHL